MPEHLLSIPDAKLIATRPFELAQELLDEAAACHGIVALLGEGGHGKSIALDYWAEEAPVPVSTIVPFKRTSARQFVADVLQAVRQDPEPPVGTEFTITPRIVEEITRPWLLGVDEAQWLERDALKSARGLWMKRRDRLALAFAGGPEFEEKLVHDQMLRRRLIGIVRFEALSEDDIVEILPGYHPIYEHADLVELLRVNRDYCGGCFGLWETFTRWAAQYCARHDLPTLTSDASAFALERCRL